jgi:DNA-directed RNA polymerase subunit beta'
MVRRAEGAETREYSLPRGVHVNVQEGDRVRAGEPLMDGPRNPHDILVVLGEKELQS